MAALEHWLEAEVDYIRAFPEVSDEDLAVRLTALTGLMRTRQAVTKKRQALGIYKQGRGPLPPRDPSNFTFPGKTPPSGVDEVPSPHL